MVPFVNIYGFINIIADFISVSPKHICGNTANSLFLLQTLQYGMLSVHGWEQPASLILAAVRLPPLQPLSKTHGWLVMFSQKSIYSSAHWISPLRGHWRYGCSHHRRLTMWLYLKQLSCNKNLLTAQCSSSHDYLHSNQQMCLCTWLHEMSERRQMSVTFCCVSKPEKATAKMAQITKF